MGTSLPTDVLFALKMISDSFPVGKLKGVGRKLGGSYNLNIKIETSKGEFVARIMNRSNRVEHLNYVQTVLANLTEQGLPVLNPILTQEGEAFISFNDKLLQVTPFVRAETFQNSPKQVAASARMLSTFHQAIQFPQSGPEPVWSFNRPSDYYSNALADLKRIPGIPSHQLSEAEKLAEDIMATWNQSQKDLPSAIIHGDWHFWNQLYKDNEVYSIMDFDFMEHGKRIHDIAYSMWVIYIILPKYTKGFDELFIKEYIGLTEEEVSILPVAIARVSLFFLCQSAYAANPEEKWRRHFRKQIPLIRWLLSNSRFHEILRENNENK
ncbi:phosphotransferase enzyme family protein [Paenibacillus terrigena]|uniref:phosphotransferase enzyme family protein n=1 Tax=Paenibacillus terrigena TaxID=369333 RepID=UPI00037CF586|nr:phosphotransferase [Paenibacillus terrigena]